MMSERSNVNVTMESVFHFDEDEYFLFAIVRLFVCVVFVKIFFLNRTRNFDFSNVIQKYRGMN